MTIKVKVVSTTLAASMAVALLAGLPAAGNHTWAAKTGLVGVASASSKDDLESKVNQLYSKLSPTEISNLRGKASAFKAVLEGLNNKVQLADPLLQHFNSVAVSEEQKTALADLLTTITSAILLPPNWDEIEAKLTSEPVTVIVHALEDDIGGGFDLTVDMLAQLALDLYNEADQLIKSNTYTTQSLLDSSANRKDFVHAIMHALRTKPAYGGVYDDLYSTLLDKYFDGNRDMLADALDDVYQNYYDALGVEGRAAAKAFAASLASAYVKANSPSSSGSSGGGGTVSQGQVESALDTLNGLKDKLANATAEEKDKLVKDAVAQASAAVASVAKVDATSLLQTNGDQSTAIITSSAIADLLKNVQSLKDALNNALGSTDGLVIPPLVIDFGTSASANVTVSVASDVLAQVTAAGFGTVAVAENGLKAAIPLAGEFNKGFDFSIAKQAGTSDKTKGLPVASDIYNFSVKVDGQAYEGFSQPIVISFPVHADGLDRELLTVARIEEDGSLSFQGGDLNGDTIDEPRYSFSSYVVLENKVSFDDIAKVQDWAGRQIVAIAAKGAIQGKAPGQFAPSDSITRAEFAKILVTALNLDNPYAKTDKFSDVSSSDWYAPYVAVAVDKGIINGRSATTFDPNATITRAELSTMIARALKAAKGVQDVENVNAALAAFSDVGTISSSLKAGVALAASKNIVIGYNGKFNPNSNATRAEAAVIIYRAINTKA